MTDAEDKEVVPEHSQTPPLPSNLSLHWGEHGLDASTLEDQKSELKGLKEGDWVQGSGSFFLHIPSPTPPYFPPASKASVDSAFVSLTVSSFGISNSPSSL